MSGLQQKLMETACRLIEFESTAESREERAAIIAYAAGFFEDSGTELFFEGNLNAPSLIISTQATKCPDILLHGHLDVVGGLPEQFTPREAKGRLYGRGTIDMKGFVAVAMHVLRDLASLPDPPSVGLMINTDEEVGGRMGCGALVENGWATRLLINGDGGYGKAVSHAQKGIIQIELEANTEPGQRYAPWDGEDAATLLVRKLQDGLSQLCPAQNSLTAENNWGNTYRILNLVVESNDPMPPACARASVRMYWADEESGEDIKRRIAEVFAPLGCSIEIVADRIFLSQDSPLLLSFRELWEENLGEPISVRADNGPSDAKWFAPLDIPVILMRFPGAGAHTTSEWLEISAFEPLYHTLYQFILNQTANVSSKNEGVTLAASGL